MISKYSRKHRVREDLVLHGHVRLTSTSPYCVNLLVELLISSYFNIVKRTVIDTVPKAIMLNLVNLAKEELQRELLQELYKTDVLDELLKESEFTTNRRKECKKMIEALHKADGIVGSGMCLQSYSMTDLCVGRD